MKYNKIYGLILAISVLIFSGCGNDTKENPAAPDGPYSFFNATTPLNITKPVEVNGTVEGEGVEISVQLLKYGLAEPGQPVEMKPFDYRFGSLVNTVVETDENGRAIFLYNAPTSSDYNAIRGNTITIQAIFEAPIDPDANVVVDDDAPPVIILTQDFELTFF